MADPKKVCILSIDGGGIRGILPGVILNALEEKLRAKKGDDARIAHYFDLIAGTSTGGILSCAYLMPDDNGNPKFTAAEAVDLYLKRGGDIFNVSFKKKILSVAGVTDEKYDERELEKALKDNFEDKWLSELLKPCLITSYDIEGRDAFFLRQHKTDNDDHNFLIRDVARATSAAPTYFEASHIKSKAGNEYPLVDGGVFANNPAMCAYSEARTMTFEGKTDYPCVEDMMFVSVGTGGVKEPYMFDSAKDWGMLQWIQPVIDIMMSGNSETVRHQLKQIYGTLEGEDSRDYHRLEPSLGGAKSNMDDASDKNLKALENAGLSFVEDPRNSEELDAIVEKLIRYNG
ncbi:MAG: patatin-like phospholipase family protein [Bacteroidota bacterium]